MGRRAVEIEVVLLDVFPVIALAIGQAEQPLLQDLVLAIPQGNGKTQPLVVVTDTGEAILAPVIGARAGLIVVEVIPRIAVLAVVLAHRAPLALAEVRAPLLPRHALLARFFETLLFRRSCALRNRSLRHCRLLPAESTIGSQCYLRWGSV